MAADATAIGTDPSGQRASAEVRWLAPGRHGQPSGARLLDVDPGLGCVLDPEQRERLAPLLRVRVGTLDVGTLTRPAGPGSGTSLGLLVLEGLLLRDLSVCGRRSAEVLGPGDLLRPWVGEGPEHALNDTGLAWQVVDGPVRVAVLDARASLLIGRFPPLVSELLDRTLARSQFLQYQLALSQIRGIEQRLELLLWQLADRWGRVTLDGVVLPVNVTHEMLGRLIGARRPSVTTALRRLGAAGKVTRRTDGWLLRESAMATSPVETRWPR